MKCSCKDAGFGDVEPCALHATWARNLIAAEREACAKIAATGVNGGYLCPYGRDKPGDITWNHTDKDKCPVCGEDGDGALSKCHDTIGGRIAAAIRERNKV